jgi:hypothetical protein
MDGDNVMSKDNPGIVNRPFRAETVYGEPYYIGDRRLTPVARVVSFGKARANIGTDTIAGWGAGFVHVKPVAILEERGEESRHIAINRRTEAILRQMLGVAVALTIIFTAIRWAVRR